MADALRASERALSGAALRGAAVSLPTAALASGRFTSTAPLAAAAAAVPPERAFLAAFARDFLERPESPVPERNRPALAGWLYLVFEGALDLLPSSPSDTRRSWRASLRDATTGGSSLGDEVGSAARELRDSVLDAVHRALPDTLGRLLPEPPGGDEHDDDLADEPDEQGLLAQMPPELLASVGPGTDKWATALAASLLSVPNSLKATKYDGQAVHLAIQAHYRSRPQHLGHDIVTERSVYSPCPVYRGTIAPLAKEIPPLFPELRHLNVGLRGGLRIFKKPDMLNFSRHEVHEIKPRRRALRGLAQVEGYAWTYNALRAANPDLRALAPGAGTYEPPALVPLASQKVAVPQLVPGVPGVIIYDLFPFHEERTSPSFSPGLSPDAWFQVMLAVLLALAMLALILFGPEVAGAAIVVALLAAVEGANRGTSGSGVPFV